MSDLAAGADAFRLLATRLRDLGETGLRRDLSKAVSDAARPVLGEVRTELPGHMPNRYARTLDEDLQLTLSQRTNADTPGVTLRATTRGRGGRRRIRRLDSGVLAHPLFGNRRHWYEQASHVSAGFFTGPAQDSAPRVRDAILHAMHDVAAKVLGKA